MQRALAAFLLRLIGWQTVFTPPPGPKTVIIVYPHTSNWDFPLGILFRYRHGLFVHWAGKDTLFRWPLRRLLLSLGGVPINRRERTGMITQLTERFRSDESFHIGLTPEGTRSKTDHWKSGFYRLAMNAGVPVGLATIDFATRRVGIERWITLSGDEDQDLAAIRAHYAGKRGLYPEKQGTIRFLKRVGPGD